MLVRAKEPSPPLFNIGTISQYFWTIKSKLYGYADDGFDLISAPTVAECNLKIKEVMKARQQWYALSGMALNIQKTALIGFGFTPDNVNIENFTIEPVTSIKFLGFIIQDDLGLEQQVKAVANKIRTAAPRQTYDQKVQISHRKIVRSCTWDGCRVRYVAMLLRIYRY